MTWHGSLINFRPEMTTKDSRMYFIHYTVNLIIKVILYCSSHKMLDLFSNDKDEVCDRFKIYIKFNAPTLKLKDISI